MDQELVAYLDVRFSETSRQIQELREEMDQRFEKVDEAIRYTQISVEGSRSDIQLLAEGIMGLTERLESFQVEAAKGFEDAQHGIRWPYSVLDQRLRRLEHAEELRRREPLEIIRERFGKPRT